MRRNRFYSDCQAPVVQKVDNVIHRINHYPLDSAIGLAMTYPLDSDLSGGLRYPSFEQLGPDDFTHQLRTSLDAQGVNGLIH